MREDIVERIKMIRNGHVPKEYKKTEKGIIPITWKAVQLGDSVNIFRGASPRPKGDPRYYGGEIPRVLIEDLTRDGKIAYPCLDSLTEEGAKKSRLLEKGALVMSCSGTRVGITGFLGVDACIHDGFLGFNKFDNLDKEYLYYLLQCEAELLQIKATKGGVFNNLTTDIIKNLNVNLPSLEEQKRIAIILGKYDEYKDGLTKMIEKKQRQRKWLIENMMSGKRRIHGFVDEWKSKSLKSVLEETDKRNNGMNISAVYSINNRLGFVRQNKQFGKIVASSDLTGYKIVGEGCIAYNPSRINVGSIALYSEKTEGVISPMYVVVNTKKSLDERFFIYYTKTDEFNRCVRKKLSGSVRETLNYQSLCEINILLPAMDEQRKIVEVLQLADKEIELLETKIDLVELEKRALMQLLLSGIVRVNEI